MMRDGFMQSLIIDRMDIDYLAYEPAVCFMNGEYYGIQNLRERSSKDYLYTNYGLDEDEFVLFDNETAPSSREYNDFIAYLKNQNVATESVYEEVKKLIDIDSYMYYMIAETFYANTDWPQNNYKIWKKNINGRWRWILFDTDFGFGHVEKFDHNTVRYVFQESDSRITYPLRRLMVNEQFKQKFLNRFCIQVSSTFSTQRVNAVMDSLSAKIRNEIVYHKQKWGGNNFDTELDVLKTFAKQRPNRLMQFFGSYFFQTSLVIDIYMRSNIDGIAFTFNGEPVPDNPVILKYFKNKDINIEASKVTGYRFKQWEMAAAPQENTSVAFGSYWNYWDKNGQPAENWMNSNYDDAAWKQGYAPLGYGNFDKKTTIDYGSDGNNK
jgi:hypothetical protein